MVEEKETRTPAPKSGDRRTARLSRTRLKRRRAPSKFPALPTNGLCMRGAGEREPTENPNRLTAPFILDSLGLGMDGTNQKCKSRKRSRETDRSATTRTRVGGVLSASYHSCSGKDPQLSKGATNRPNHCSKPPLYSMDSAYPLSINKMKNGGEMK